MVKSSKLDFDVGAVSMIGGTASRSDMSADGKRSKVGDGFERQSEKK